MKSLFVSLFIIPSTFAGTIISKREVMLPVKINANTVKLSSAGYSRPLVKVLIPDLADVTLLNHRNFGEDAPCMSTVGAEIPEDVVKNDEKTENIKFSVILTKTVYPDSDNKTCLVSLSEDITATIRGFKFTHERSASLQKRVLEDCR